MIGQTKKHNDGKEIQLVGYGSKIIPTTIVLQICVSVSVLASIPSNLLVCKFERPETNRLRNHKPD